MLENTEGKRIACIVYAQLDQDLVSHTGAPSNDMAEVNIDAALIRGGSGALKQAPEELVQLQNGCICCTLRADLLREVARLAQTGAFDYCVIESTGISEPMQVAETFSVSLDDLEAQLNLEGSDAEDAVHKRARIMDSARSLKKLARLDTCVTVVDAASFFDTFQDARALSEQFGDEVDPEDERNIVDLMVDQIEFANVIVVNKCDLVTRDTLNAVLAVVKKLNPGAYIIESIRSIVPLDKVLNTGLFDIDLVSQQAGWLQSLNEPVKPETLEYGVGSLVYRRRRPFHPKRFHELINKFHCLEEIGQETADVDDGERQDAEGEDSGRDDEEEDEDDGGGDDEEFQAKLEVVRKTIVQARKASPFAGVLRSKGFVWLAGTQARNDNICFWSGAGVLLQVGVQGPWFCLRDRDTWPDDVDGVLADIGDYEHGDRRQEIVFIGIGVDQQKLLAALDACLVTDDEWANAATLEDPLLSWEL